MKCLIAQPAVLLVATMITAFPARCADITERDTIAGTLKFSDDAVERSLLVDNLNGYVRVTGSDRNDIQIVAYRTIRADSRRRFERAKEEVVLQMRKDFDRVLIYVDAPWRREDGSMHYRGWDYEGYEVVYDIELKVPSDIEYKIKTVNDGDIEIRNMKGPFLVRNVNGGIDMRNIDGSGDVSTVNGSLNISFTRNPGSEVNFKTVNGDIEAIFPSPPAANLKFKTFNGEVYSDFDVKSVPLPMTVKEKRGGIKVYGSGGSFMVESGGGGPQMSFNTLNGDIYLSLKGERK